MKILLIDDDESIATVFETALKKDGHEVFIAQEGQTGVELAKTKKPDVILLDQLLPDMSGNEILKVLKSDSHTSSIPVMLLSNYGQQELIQEAIHNGAAEYILKYKIQPEDLCNSIKRFAH